ncbi:M1 family metallopeptidase [Terriglobus albidus]|uniref:M1 family metallopeptidase n=1 Tax=Terriglobus albidus TaxID=1592106 RepID=A0A5B9E800_9BACT|nr:M1 family metallopeptidase [Terriglobus albidus]QEE27694.1 M1 family metallopeptidase [Terriglobus albidus]
MRKTLFLALLSLATALGAQTSIATNSPTPLSERVVQYTIDAQIDPVKHTVDASETLTYRNLTGQRLTNFPFHLYLNAFQQQSTFARETAESGGFREVEREYPEHRRGEIRIVSVTADGFGDLTSAQRFTAPDDGNTADHTVMEIPLPHPLEPGETITFHIAFHDKFPESIARNGYKRDFMMGGQWFPKVGVFWHGAWNCHQYHATTEFFSDFGSYNVKLTVPENYTVGTTGVSTGITHSGGRKTMSFYAEDVHDFAWAASPHFTETTETYLSAMGPVRIRVLALKSHPQAGPRYAAILRQTMAKFEQWYGPYPYKQITVIDPEPGSAMEGMEYPTLITGGTDWWEPSWLHLLEVTAEHEFGHQYWYGMVATNEFEEAWLDEGINSYTEVKVIESLFGKDKGILGGTYASAGERDLQRYEYTFVPDYDPMTRFAYQFYDERSYGGVTYGKTATALLTLEGIIGEDTMREAVHQYFTKYRFKHPTAKDFLQEIENTAIAKNRVYHIAQPSGSFCGTCAHAAAIEVAPALHAYFQQAIYGTAVLDYAVDSVTTQPFEWWKPEPADPKQTDYLSTVVLHRKGDFILPVSAEVIFDNGLHSQLWWDGSDRWQKFTFKQRGAKVVSVEIDPNHTVLLDKDRFNNSYQVTPHGTAARKLTAIILFLEQCLSQVATWIV